MILIVDDHVDTGWALALLLRSEGIQTECVNDPIAAICFIQSVQPSLLVLDQMMPGLLGTDLLRAIRGIPSLAAIPAIFYSASRDGEADARRLGALDWLVKGNIRWEELRRRIVAVYKAKTADDSRPAGDASTGEP